MGTRREREREERESKDRERDSERGDLRDRDPETGIREIIRDRDEEMVQRDRETWNTDK